MATTPSQAPLRPSLRPLLKWSGGKRSEIPFLKSAYPPNIQRVIEPFSGGAAVSFELNPGKIVLNDLSAGLVQFYRTMQNATQRDEMVACLEVLDQVRKKIAKDVDTLPTEALNQVFASPDKWVAAQSAHWLNGMPGNLAALVKKDLVDQANQKTVKRIPKLEIKMGMVFDEGFRRKHLETGLQSGLYTTMRRLYNGDEVTVDSAWGVAAWWFVRSLCYSGMFRYSKSGKYNVPYGGIGYNSRDFASSVKQLLSADIIDFFERATVFEMDFETLFQEHQYFQEGDFVFVDPPYDSAFSQYNHETDFGRSDQERLALALSKTKAPWMLVIKNTPFILSLYQGEGLYRGVFGKTYQANFRNRHSRAVEHLVVTNYPIPYAEIGEIGILREA